MWSHLNTANLKKVAFKLSMFVSTVTTYVIIDFFHHVNFFGSDSVNTGHTTYIFDITSDLNGMQKKILLITNFNNESKAKNTAGPWQI
jgi:hypothetical protein